MSEQQDSSLRVATVGMDERMRSALQLFFQGQCRNSCVLVHEGSAEISIVDLDGYQGQQLLEEHRTRYPQRPLIALSLKQVQLDGVLCLEKPLNPQKLLAALHQLKAQMVSPGESLTESADAEAIQGKRLESASEAPERPAPPRAQKEEETRQEPGPEETEEPSGQSTHLAAMRLHERNSNTFIGSAPDIDPNNPKQVADAQYDPDDFFQSYLKRAFGIAEAENCDVRIGNQRGSLRIQARCRMASVEMSENLLRTLSVVPVMNGAVSISRLKDEEPLPDTAERTLLTPDALLWKTALWASRGRVPVGTRLTDPVYLRQWPNMPRLYVFPHSLRIAALLIKEPYSLVDVARVLDIPQRNVFAFYSAAFAIGLVGPATRAVDTMFEPAEVKEHRRRGLLSRLLGRLHLK